MRLQHWRREDRYHSTGADIGQIARDLKVAYVVQGGVQRQGVQERITARLIRVSDQTTLWSATYDRDLGQVVATPGRNRTGHRPRD
jgi:TolB-like protein